MAITVPAHLIYVIISPLCSSLLVCLNIVTVFVFVKRFRLATLTLIIVVNICICDIFVSLISNTFYVANLWHPQFSWTTGSVCCKLFKFFTMVANISQIYLLCFLNADRLRRLVSATMKQWCKRHGVLFSVISWSLAVLLCIPRLFQFDESLVTTVDQRNNVSVIVNYNCKAVGVSPRVNEVITLATFVLAYALPASFILYTLFHAQYFMFRRRSIIHIACTKNAVTRMNNKLALTFNLTGALFMVVWTPFFILSLVDLRTGLVYTKAYTDMNFSMRCTLLLLGSAKPMIYVICLDKFRNSLKCGLAVGDGVRSEQPSNGDRSGTGTHQIALCSSPPKKLSDTNSSEA